MNSIGTYEFAIMIGVVPQPRQKIQIIQRPGVSGFVRRRDGIQSPTYQITTMVDMLSLELARQEQHGYVSLINGIPVKLIKDDFDYKIQGVGGHAPFGIWVAVLDVETLVENKRASIAGGINGGDWELRVRWTLRSTPTTV